MNTNHPTNETLVFHGITFVPIWAGSVVIDRNDKTTVLQLERDVYIGKYPITRSQYVALGGNQIWLTRRENKPAIDISYYSALDFCESLNREARKQGQPFFFRLPNEIEWEYICRAGSTALYPYGDKPGDIHLHACFSENSGYIVPEPFDEETIKLLPYHSGGCEDVGKYLPNAFGIHDMCGNVWEWCEPFAGNDEAGRNNVDTSAKVLKGGSWTDAAEKLTCEFRRLEDPEVARSNIGFRVVMVRTESEAAISSSEPDDPLIKTLPESSLTNSIGMNLIRLTMKREAVPNSEKGEMSGLEMKKNILVAQTPVTVQQFLAVMGHSPQRYKAGRSPIQLVTWQDAQAFCRKLTDLPQEIAAKRHYRLPTEEEWEYACRAGHTATTAEQLRDFDFESLAWTRENSRNKIPFVGLKTPNGFGLHDMLGCVAEWCDTDYVEEAEEPTRKLNQLSDPFVPNEFGFVAELYNPKKPLKLACGGSWLLDRSQAYFWSRLVLPKSHRSIHVGFRVVLEQH